VNNVAFARNLVKGKIAETIFAQMLRDTGHFTVLEFGYEKIIPQLIQEDYQDTKGTLEILRTSPDFAVINKKDRKVSLIEVKYLKEVNFEYVYRYAKRMGESWNPSYLFLMTQKGFYFDEVNSICEREGEIPKLEHHLISQELQEKYLQILKDFEGNN
jgi:hypothetical protein